jgi:hypothetical protein
MLLQALISLVLAIVTRYISRNLSDEAIRIVAILLSYFCLFVSLILAPWIVNFLILVALLMIPIYIRTGVCRQLCHIKSCDVNCQSK